MKKFLAFIVIIVPAAFFLITPGFYEPHDLHHVADIYQMARAIQSGQFPPRLGPDFTFGYGYPLFNFYYVLPFYLGALFFFLVGSLMLSFKLVFLVSIILSVIGMYLFLKELLEHEWSAVVGAILFLYTPYRAVQIYVRGAMGEAFALAILPIFAWTIVKVVKNPRLLNVVLMGVVGALFILSHNYFWVLVAPWLLMLIFVIPKRNRIFVAGRVFLGGLLSLALSFYWWFPAIIEQKLVSATTPFPLIDHFPFIKQLILPSWGYGASLWGPGDGFSFQIGVVNLGVMAVLAILLVANFRKTGLKKYWVVALWVTGGFLVNLFMMNVRSYPLWRLLPFYNFIQFPWRLLSLTTFFTSIAAGLVVVILPGNARKIVIALIGLSCVLLTFTYFQPSGRFFKEDNDYLRRFFANRSVQGQTAGLSKEYLLYSEDYLQLPNLVKERPEDLPVAKIVSDDAKVFDIVEISPISWKARVEAFKKSKVTFWAFYFPGWRAELDGKAIEMAVGENGEIEADIEKGMHDVAFYWHETDMHKFADVVSLGTVSILLVGFVYGKWRRRL